MTAYSTPLSDEPLPLDTEVINKLRASSPSFESMSRDIDEREHSMELHLPYIHRRLQLQFPDRRTSEYPPLVPIMVGSTSASTERTVGTLLAPYLNDASNVFIISSDFCHWGRRFAYTYYVPHAPVQNPPLPLSYQDLPQPPTTVDAAKDATDAVSDHRCQQSMGRKTTLQAKIYDSISAVDIATMKAITTGATEQFLNILRLTGNTVCGRHPIGVIMAAMEEAAKARTGDTDHEKQIGPFRFLRYERSSDPVDVADSSVSYVSAVAVA